MSGRSLDPRPESLVDAAAKAVLEVGGLLREWRCDTSATSGVWEGDQFKARADAMAHDVLSTRLRAIDPGLPVLSEEDPDSLVDERPDRYWLIDPIDGTASYAHGFAGYVTQAALMVGARPAAAAVYAPEPDVLYTAVRGTGAASNGRRLPTTAPAPPGKGALIDNTPRPHGIARAAYEHFGYTEYVESGSLALKLCRIADGSAHLFIKDVPVRDWDVAAPDLVLEETGAALAQPDGTAFGYSGGFEHPGLVAAADPATLASVVAWHRSRPHGGGAGDEAG
ncbi:MAG: inositol monophosphatase [Nocardiopsaceae bacterium]|nr:inositol monophosphatase [Nocardiopsaceae bacterium]